MTAYDFGQLYQSPDQWDVTQTNTMTEADAFAWYNRHGWIAFPVRVDPANPGDRRLIGPEPPYSFDTLAGLTNEEIRAAQEAWQLDWRVGLVLSKASGKLAIDVDDMGQWERFCAEFGTPGTLYAQSGREGGGLHVIFSRPDDETITRLGDQVHGSYDAGLRQRAWSAAYPNIEVKSKGFVVAPPSVHGGTGRRYQWAGGTPGPAEISPDLMAARLEAQRADSRAARVAEERENLEVRQEARAAMASREPIVLVPAAEIRQREMPPFLVDGMMPAQGIGVMFGDTGVYKSFLVLNLLLCVGADSAAFLGHMVNGTGWGIYVMGEGQYDAGPRLDAALTAHLGFTDDRLRYIEQAFPLSDETSVSEVITKCKALAESSGVPVRLLVFDSFADFYGSADSENSATDMQRLIASMKKISAELGCVVMANAHTGHGGKDEDGEDRPPPARLRGSSRFRQAFDFEWMATGQSVLCTKNRYGPLFEPVHYEMARQGGSLVVSAESGRVQPSQGEAPLEWPHPCPLDKWVKVLEAVQQTPGMNLTTIQKVTRTRRADVQLALLKGEEAGVLANTGTSSRPTWVRAIPRGFTEWAESTLPSPQTDSQSS